MWGCANGGRRGSRVLRFGVRGETLLVQDQTTMVPTMRRTDVDQGDGARVGAMPPNLIGVMSMRWTARPSVAGNNLVRAVPSVPDPLCVQLVLDPFQSHTFSKRPPDKITYSTEADTVARLLSGLRGEPDDD